MFFAVQKNETTRMVKASNYDELVLKATSSFKVNPNVTTLSFVEPSGDQILLDSEDTYEYVEQRTQELKAESSSYKPTIVLGGNTDTMPEPANKNIGRAETSISSNSRATVSDMVVRPVDAS